MHRTLFLFAFCMATPATAQSGYQNDSQGENMIIQQSPSEAPQGETGRSVADAVGQRQNRDQIAANAGIKPMARVNGRVQNRIQARIRNRIDRYYDPQANSLSPFEAASDQNREAGRAAAVR